MKKWKNETGENRIVNVLTVLILLLSAFAALMGVCSKTVHNYPDQISVYGETIQLYQIGIYGRDSISMASQAIAQDVVTLLMGLPLLAISLVLVNRRKSIRGWFLLAGILGYFLYTYTTYAMLMIYNRLYLVYILLMALSFYAFFLAMRFLCRHEKEELFNDGYPEKALGIYFLIAGVALAGMWMGRILPTLTTDTAPYGLEHYSTLVIQSLDLGIILPTCLVTAWLLHKRQKWGYLLSAVLVMKMLTMAAAISAMAVNMKLHQVEMGLADLLMFPIIMVVNIIFLVRILRTIHK